ncbi:hypothetical protein K7X08_019497 [Anisodus acutangulus]|uniref:Fe2OG dioxygenase domain-containing protein n=1 Tax=Anisodus acutangulus TaxID=402998 RepID=A0A9Q1MSN0_9SOLA|nr:hypothetical protein K7X08_019497 [Anisodus acutangulus]
MATDFKSIPLIDISPILEKWDHPNVAQDEGVTQVVKQLDQDCLEAGFSYVAIILLLLFFLFLREVKHGMYGDLGEVMLGSNIWPSNPSNFKHLMEHYVDLCTGALLRKLIMRGIALALGGSADEMEGEIAGDPFWVLRTIGYPAASISDGHDKADNVVGCGAHTDYGLLTLLNQDDDILALQVRNKSGEWISAPPIPGTFVCNIGDMLKILSNGIYKSTLHRVINTSPKYRVCPNFDAVIEQLDVCIQKTGGTKNFEGAVYGKHLVSKVTTYFVM